MSSSETIYEKLLKLNEYEQIAQMYYKKRGQNLSYDQLYYLMRHRPLANPIDRLLSAEARSEQEEYRLRVRAENAVGGLSEQWYMDDTRTAEIEQLLRYVHIPRHYHDFFELVCVLDGHCRHEIGEMEICHAQGDFTIIPPGVEHELHAETDCVCLTIKLRSSRFQETFSDILSENSMLSSYFSQMLRLPRYRYALTLHCGSDRFFRDTLLNMVSQQDAGLIYSDSIIKALLTALFAYMLQGYQDSAEFLLSDAHSKMGKILNYIYENYQSITLAEAARHFYLSPAYLSTKIHALTGSTFSQLLRTHKFQRAAELLVQTDMTLECVCEAVGYQNTAQFIRSFRELYGSTPGQWRRSHRQ